jgi:hypothetical protein
VFAAEVDARAFALASAKPEKRTSAKKTERKEAKATSAKEKSANPLFVLPPKLDARF